MIVNGGLGIHGDVHRAHDRAGAIGLAGGFAAADAEDAKHVAQAKHCTVRAGIFAPGAFNEEG